MAWSLVEVARCRAVLTAAVLTGAYADALAAAVDSQGVALRVWAPSPWLVLVADDRAAPLSDSRVEGLQRVLGVALGLRHVELRRLSDEPAWRRHAAWSRALRVVPASDAERRP